MYNKYYQNEDVSADALNFIDAKITNVQLKAFYFRSNKNLGDILERALKSLKAQCLIEYEEQWVEIINGKHRLVDEELYPDILDCKKAVLDEHGYRTPFPFVIQGKQKEFYSEFVNKVRDEFIPNIQGIYKRLRITYARNHLIEGIYQNWQDRLNLINEAKQDLNNKIIIRMNTDADNNYSSYLKMCGPSIGRGKHFLSAQAAICDYLIKLDTDLDGRLAEYEEFRENQGDCECQVFDDLPLDELGWV